MQNQILFNLVYLIWSIRRYYHSDKCVGVIQGICFFNGGLSDKPHGKKYKATTSRERKLNETTPQSEWDNITDTRERNGK